MKLSDIKGERTFDVIADLIDPIANIATDEEAVAMFKREPCPEGMEPRDFMLGRIRKSAPRLLKSHKKDLIAIIATINDVKPSAYAKELNLARLLADLNELLDDDDFKAFLS